MHDDISTGGRLQYDKAYVFPSISIFTRGQFWPSGIVVACVCPSIMSLSAR